MWAEATFSNISWAPAALARAGREGRAVQADGGAGAVTWHHPVLGRPAREVPCVQTNLGELYQNVADHINEGVELIVKPEEARRYVAIYEAAYASAKKGQAVAPK